MTPRPRTYVASTYAESFRVRLLRTNNVPDDSTVMAFIAHIQDEAARDALVALREAADQLDHDDCNCDGLIHVLIDAALAARSVS